MLCVGVCGCGCGCVVADRKLGCVAADDEKLPSLIDGDLYIFLAELGTRGRYSKIYAVRSLSAAGRWDSYRRAAPLGRFAGEPGVQDRAALEASLGMVER